MPSATIPTIQRVDAPVLLTRAPIQSVDVKARTAEIVFSTGSPVDRLNWMTGAKYIETLGLEPKNIRWERLNSGHMNLLNAHRAEGVEDILGVVVANSGRIINGEARATVRFSKRDAVEPIWQDVQDGILRNISVGYRIHKYEETEGPPVTRHAVDWEPFEISAVPIGADAGAQVRGHPKTPTNPCVIERVTRRAQETTIMDEARPLEQPELIDPNDPGRPLERAVDTPPVDERIEDRAQATLLERERCEGIDLAVESARLSKALARKMIADGTSLLDARGIVLQKLRETDASTGGPKVGVRPDIEVGDPNASIWRGISNALLHRVSPGSFKLEDIGRNYRGLTLIEIAKMCLQARGVRTTGMSKMDVAGTALGLHTRGGMHTTSDFAVILADIASKTLRQAYEEAPQTFTAFSRRTTLPDFKPMRRTQLGEAPALLKVLEHGEFTRGTIGEGQEQYQLATYGRVFAITRQALVNDDTDAFSRLTTLFGRSARDLESNLVWEQITSNPIMGDSVALFSSTHGNLSATNDAISVASISAARAAMRRQTGLDGVQKLNIMPRFLVVPTGKETIADQFTTVNMNPAQPSEFNPFSGRLEVITEPRLDDNSATAWYIFAASDRVDVIEYATLEGEEGPVVEERLGFDIDGLEVKCRHDFAAKVIDWRGVYKNHGA